MRRNNGDWTEIKRPYWRCRDCPEIVVHSWGRIDLT